MNHSENHRENHEDFSWRKYEIFTEQIRIFIEEIKIFLEKIIKKIIEKLPKSLPAGFLSRVQETGQIPDCGFYLPDSMSRNDPVCHRHEIQILSYFGGTYTHANAHTCTHTHTYIHTHPGAPTRLNISRGNFLIKTLLLHESEWIRSSF